MLARSIGAACARLTNAITSANANGRAGDTTATGFATALARVSDMRGQGDRAARASSWAPWTAARASGTLGGRTPDAHVLGNVAVALGFPEARWSTRWTWPTVRGAIE